MTYDPGRPHKWSLSFDINMQPGRNGARRQHLLGGPAQLLLLARPGRSSPRSCPSTTIGSWRSTAPSSGAFTGGWAAPERPLRIRTLDGFNEGWIEFSDNGRSAVKGTTTLDSVIAELVEASRAKAAA
jgi:hypothetical protein